MKAYVCDAGDIQINVDQVDGYYVYETDRAICILFAESRGQARAMMAHEYHLDFTDKMAIRQIEGEYDRPVGLLDYPDDLADELWYQAALIMGGEEETCPICKGECYIRQLIGYSYDTPVRDYTVCDVCHGKGKVVIGKGKLF